MRQRRHCGTESAQTPKMSPTPAQARNDIWDIVCWDLFWFILGMDIIALFGVGIIRIIISWDFFCDKLQDNTVSTLPSKCVTRVVINVYIGGSWALPAGA